MFDLLLKDASFITMDEQNPQVRWIAVSDGIISAMGNSNDLPTAREVVSFNNMTVFPGFIDSHVHGTLTGEFLNSADLNGVNTKKGVLDAIAEKSNASTGIITAGCFSKEDYQGPMFTSHDLDEIRDDVIILIYDKSYHGCYLNTKGLEAAKIEIGMPGAVVLNGELTGELSDDTTYYSAINNLMLNIDQSVIEDYMAKTSKFALSKGVTTIHSLDGADYGVDMPIWITEKDKIDLQVVNYWETLDVSKAIEYEQKQVGGCICLDGTRVLRTMALSKPYQDDSSTRGILYYSDMDILKFVRSANENNMQCAMHATGTRCIDQYIYLLRQVIMEQGQKHLRHRIEHFSYPSEEQIEMAVELELALPMQPIFPKIWDEGPNSLYKQRFGIEEAAKIEPIADVIRAGGIVCGGSDSPVTTMSPLDGIDASVNTDNVHRKLSVKDAIKLFTVNGAWAGHEDAIKGSLEIGKQADLVVLDKNPFEFEKEIKDIKVMKTFVKGKEVFSSADCNS